MFILFYTWNTVYTWGLFTFGIYRAREWTWFSIGMFGFQLTLLGILIYSGSLANRKKRYSDFLLTKISEKKAIREEEQVRIKQEEEYKKKLAEKNALE